MTAFAGQSTRTLTTDLRAPQRVTNSTGYTYDVAVHGSVNNTMVSGGCVPKGAFLDPTKCRVHVDQAANGTTPGWAVYLCDHTTGTLDANPIITSAQITAGTVGVYRGTDAQFANAGRTTKLPNDCEVVIVFTSGAGDQTQGQMKAIIAFDHDLDPTSY